MASSVALQAYFENRKIDAYDVDECVRYWRDHISEMGGRIDGEGDGGGDGGGGGWEEGVRVRGVGDASGRSGGVSGSGIRSGSGSRKRDVMCEPFCIPW